MWWGMIIGRNWSQRAIIFGTLFLYIYMYVTRKKDAEEGVRKGLNTFKGLFTLIFAAVLLASAIKVLIPMGSVQNYLGPQAGLKGVVSGGFLGGLMQGGPYAVYPIIKGLQQSGVSATVVISMMIGYGAIGSGKVVYGLAFFGPKLISLRVALGIALTLIASLILSLVFL